MSNEKQISDNLELEEKIAVSAVFLLAGWFLWQFLGDKDVSLKLTDTQSEMLEESPSRVRLFKDDNTANVDQVTSSWKNNPASLVNNNTEVAITTPTIYADRPELSRQPLSPSRIAPIAAITTSGGSRVTEITSSHSPLGKEIVTPEKRAIENKAIPAIVEPIPSKIKIKETVIPAIIANTVTSPTSEAIPAKAIVNNKIAPPIVEQVQPKIKETVRPAIIAKSISTPAALTIQPVSTDLSTGLLKLSGTGQAESHLQLLLNGRKSSNILVDAKGLWQYETNLKPGEYSVQVLSFAENQQGGIQSVLTHITMPELPAPVSPIGANVPIVIKMKPVSPAVVEVTSLGNASDMGSEQKLNDRLYQVKYGDTLNKLSRNFKVSLHHLQQVNNISDKDQIEVGQMLIIPGRK